MSDKIYTVELPMWVLQQLYVILSLADSRDIEDIKTIYTLFGIIHPVLESLELEAKDIQHRAQALIQSTGGDPVKNEEIQPQLKELGDEHLKLQDKKVIIQFAFSQSSAFKGIIEGVISSKGIQHDQLNGYRRLQALYIICDAFGL